MDDKTMATDESILFYRGVIATERERVYGPQNSFGCNQMELVLNRLSHAEFENARLTALLAGTEKWREMVTEIEATLSELDKKSPPDEWKYYESWDGYSGYGKPGDDNYVDCPDESNYGDMHAHGWACGEWSMTKEHIRPMLAKLRALLAASDEKGAGE